MSIINAYTTNIGRKPTNQDSLLSLRALTKLGQVGMAVVCDGMGGLSKGELASKEVVNAFKLWFVKELPCLIQTGVNQDAVFNAWSQIIYSKNQALVKYGRSLEAKIGTTLAAVLIVENQYYIANVGDSRIYSITDYGLSILTCDQTLVMLDVERGQIRYEDMESDPRRNILLQCIGATDNVEPEFETGFIMQPTVFLACSDGFRHLVSEEELLYQLRPASQTDETVLAANVMSIQQSVYDRGEQDNITAVALCVT